MKPETKLGIFTIVGLALFGFSLYFLGGLSVTKMYDLNIKFADVSGLPVKAAVKLSGVEVGKVSQIKIENGDVIVVAQIHEGTAIHRGAQFSVAMNGIIGNKYLKVVQGDPAAPVYKPNEYIMGVDEIPMDVMVTQTMGSIKDFVDSINNNGVLGQQIHDTMQSVQQLVESISDNGGLGEQLNQTLSELRQLSINLNQMLVSMKPYITDSLKNVDDATGRLNDLMTSLDEGEGVIGSLLKDPEMKEEVKQSVADLHTTIREVKDVVGKMKKFQVYWDYDFFYMPSAHVSSSDLALDVYTPSGYTFYRAGLANLGNEDDTMKKNDYLEKNKFDLRLGLYNQWAQFSAGLIRGSGGVALELTPFYKSDFWKRLTVGGEFTDFGRDRVINGRRFNKANISYGVDFRFNRFFKVGAWQRDALETNNFAIKANVMFNDQDISSFFGLAAVAGSKS